MFKEEIKDLIKKVTLNINKATKEVEIEVFKKDISYPLDSFESSTIPFVILLYAQSSVNGFCLEFRTRINEKKSIDLTDIFCFNDLKDLKKNKARLETMFEEHFIESIEHKEMNRNS